MLRFAKKGKRPKKQRKPIARKARFKLYDNPLKEYEARPESDIRASAHQRRAELLADRPLAQIHFAILRAEAVRKLGLASLEVDIERIFYRYDTRGRMMNFMIVDEYVSSMMIVFEVDGETHKGCEKSDVIRDGYLLGKGIRTFRFTNDDVFKQPDNVVARLMEILHGSV